jgi:hypothetical protein
MVPEAIRGLRDNPRKGSSLAAIKGYMGEEWGINVKVQYSSLAHCSSQ